MPSQKQLSFVNEYLQDQNGTQAAIRAGYSRISAAVTSSRMLMNAKITSLVRQKQAETASKLDISREQVLLTLIEACEQAKLQKQPTAMIAACKEMARLLGFYEVATVKDKKSVGLQEFQKTLQIMTTDEVQALVDAA